MKPHIKLERETFHAWRKNLIPGKITAYEKRFSRALSRIRFARASEREVIKRINGARVVVFGDSEIVPEHQEKMLQILKEIRIGSNKTVFLNHRSKIPASLAKWLERKKITVRKVRLRGGSTSNEDRELARAIQIAAQTNEKVIVWTGAFRLVEAHLPRHLKNLAATPQYVFLHAPEIRWRAVGAEDWQIAGPSFTFWTGLSSLLSLEYLRAFHAYSGLLLSPEDLSRKFSEYCRLVTRLSGCKTPPKPTSISTAFELKRWKRPHSKFLSARIKRGESAVIPATREILLSTLEPGHAAEEAGHYVRLAGIRRPPMDRYSVALEEAFGFMASLWVDPQRKLPLPSRKPSDWALVHMQGYKLGKRMYRRWKNGGASRGFLKRLWQTRFENAEDSRHLWKDINIMM